jgi:methionyl-tRNA formyltransferase
VPIKQVATEELNLPTHIVDTFTGWTPPVPINLVIAVSFGLLVPARILSHAQYRGLNVHPSLLPDLHGPAPIEHAILKGRTHIGVSVQTLHPQRFDHGIILAQTPAPGLPIPDDITAQELEAQLAQTGATMLVDVLMSHKHVPPLRDAGCYYFGPLDHAPKITKQDRFVDFSKQTVHDIVTSQRALGDPWCLLPNGDRLILHHVRDMEIDDALNRPPGLYISPSFPHPVFVDRNGGIGMVLKSTYSGHKHGYGNTKLEQMLTLGPGDVEGIAFGYWPTILNPRALRF